MALLANLITTQAYGGKAHIVGLSLGGYVALSLTASYPSVVHSVFATGAARRADTLILPSWVIGGFLETVASWTSKKLFFWSQGWDDWNIPEGLYEDLIAAVGRGNVGKLVDAVKSHSGPKVWEKVGVRCLMVAGGREDPVEVTKEAGRILNGVCDQSRAVVVRKVGHAWDLEEPELFAEGVRAWVEGRVLPEEFEIL